MCMRCEMCAGTYAYACGCQRITSAVICRNEVYFLWDSLLLVWHSPIRLDWLQEFLSISPGKCHHNPLHFYEGSGSQTCACEVLYWQPQSLVSSLRQDLSFSIVFSVVFVCFDIDSHSVAQTRLKLFEVLLILDCRWESLVPTSWQFSYS